MICHCGGLTAEHQVVRDKEIQGKYEKCGACGRIHWWWKTDKLEQELKAENN